VMAPWPGLPYCQAKFSICLRPAPGGNGPEACAVPDRKQSRERSPSGTPARPSGVACVNDPARAVANLPAVRLRHQHGERVGDDPNLGRRMAG
jgi:hypothetical protein